MAQKLRESEHRPQHSDNVYEHRADNHPEHTTDHFGLSRLNTGDKSLFHFPHLAAE